MAVQNAHWYSRNEGRAYPVDDAASCADDAGRRLPPTIITDLNLRWPETLGRYAFLSAVSCTDSAVTLTIQAADTVDEVNTFIPLAVLTVRKPLDEGRVYQLLAQADGVAGWVTFGSGARDLLYRGRFTTPAQSRLTPRAARSYRAMPISSIQTQNAYRGMTGVVLLKVTAPLALVKEERFIEGANRDCIVIQLVDAEGAEGFQVPEDAGRLGGFKSESIFSQFAGPCAGRPESNTCGCPEPVQFINAVAPDCDGVLTIEFRGCAQVAQILEIPGVAVACQFGLVDACLPAQIPSDAGLLPNEYEPANVPVPPDVVPPPSEGGTSDSLVVGDLPALVCFTGETQITVKYGSWDYADDGSPSELCDTVACFPVSNSLAESVSSDCVDVPAGSYETQHAATRAIATYDDDVSSVYRKATTEVKLLAGSFGAKHNAQLVINYRPHQTVSGQFVYFAAEVDYDTQEFRLLRFNGTAFQVVSPASVALPGIQLDKWYKIEATTLPSGEDGDVSITIRLTSVSDPGEIDVTLSATVSNYQPSTGAFGIGTNRALSRFAYLLVEEAT